MTTTTPAPPVPAFDSDVDFPSAQPLAGFRAGVRRGAYPVVPDSVTAALSVADRVEQLQRELRAGMVETNALERSLEQRLLAGEPAEETLFAIADAELDNERRGRAVQRLGTLEPRLRDATRSVIREALPEILGGLRAELDDVVTTLRKAYADAGDLDVHQPDPMLVAQAGDAQRAAVVTIAEASQRYRRLRRAQRDALAASDLPVPGDSPWRASWGWSHVFETGVHEVSAPNLTGLPGAGLPKRAAVRAVVERRDVWLPGPDELADAFERLEQLRRQPDTPTTAAAEEPTFGAVDPASAAFLEANVRNNREARR